MIPRFSPNYSWEEIISCFLPSNSQAVTTFEKKIAQRSGHVEAISFHYGRAGLFYLLKALGVQGKKVILPSYTCVVVAHAIILSGNIPVFLDNAPGSLQPDPKQYLKAIDTETIMIIPTHLFGIAEETEELYHIVKRDFPHIFVLQDCAHSFFCEDSNSKSVTFFGDGALYGMNISKLINTSIGGMLTFKDKELAKKVKKLVQQDRKGRGLRTSLPARAYVFLAAIAFSRFFFSFIYYLTHKTSILKSHTHYYDPFSIELPKDFFTSMTPFEATVGLKSLEKYEERVRERQKIAQFYCKSLKNIPELILPPFKKGYTWSHFPLRVPIALREALLTHLENVCSTEIGKIVDYSITDLPAYQKRGYEECPLARHAAASIINLPLCFREGLLSLSHQATEKHMTRVVKTIEQFFLSVSSGLHPLSEERRH